VIQLYDATLRDGMQGADMSLSAAEKLRVAHKLDAAPAKPGQDDLDDEIVEYMCYEGESEGVPSTIPETVP